MLYRVGIAGAPVREWREILDTNEQQRADAFLFSRDCTRYVNAHVALREVLAHHTGMSPRSIPLVTGEFGKPRFAGTDAVEFSLSHCQSVAVIACSNGSALGVDVEVQRNLKEIDILAGTILTRSEHIDFTNAPKQHRARRLLIAWTRKEAILKSVGLGLQVEPRCVEAGCEPADSSVQVLLGDGLRAEVHVRTLVNWRSMLVSVAALRPPGRIYCNEWPVVAGA